MSACRSCKAPIEFARTTRGKSIPLDVKDVYVAIGDEIPPGLFKLGTVAGEQRAFTVPRDVEALRRTLVGVEDLDRGYGPFKRSHFSSCPEADEHRKKGP